MRHARLPKVISPGNSFFCSFPASSDSKESACSARGLGSISELVRSPAEGNGYQLRYSGLENHMDRGA